MEKSKPEDVGALATFPATENAAALTGRTFFVGAGMISLYSEPERTSVIYREEEE
jgi:hypothetical protein